MSFEALVFLMLCGGLLLCSLISSAAATTHTDGTGSDTRYLYPVGQTVGIKLFSDGVLVVGLSDIETAEGSSSPARLCGLLEGDIMTHINGEEISSIEEVQSLLQEIAGEDMSVRILRGDEMSQLTMTAIQSRTDGSYKLGAYIRDSMAGIGTMTYFDPETKEFGTLGHGISDADTAMLMPLLHGEIMPSTVVGVSRGAVGAPGQLQGEFETETEIGSLFANTQSGVFGTLSDERMIGEGMLYPVATQSEVSEGAATILSSVSGEIVEEFAVEIVKLYPEAQDTRDMMISVTDPRLIEATGGIVQGMSGSPILQNGKLIGAVTHVLVNDPTSGYGILIENMLESAESIAE